MLLDGTNYGALGLGVVIWWLVGTLWYAPFAFRPLWLKAQGKSEGGVRLGAEQLTGLLTALAAAFFIGVVLKWYGMAGGAVTWQTGLAIGTLAWLGGAWPLRTMELILRRTGVTLYLIDTGNALVTYALIGAATGWLAGRTVPSWSLIS